MDTLKKKTSRSDKILEIVMNNKAIFIALVIALFFSLAAPKFLVSRNLLNVLRQVCVSSIVSAGITLVLGSGNMDLSVGHMLGLIGIIMAKMLVKDIPVPLAILIGVAAGAFCGFLNAFLIEAFKLPPFIVTIASSSLFLGAGYLITNMVPVSGLPKSFVNIGQGYFFGIPIPVYIMIAVIAVMAVLTNKTAFGRHAIAMGGNLEATRVSGIDVVKTRFFVYIAMGICCALAAVVMTARSASAQVTAGDGMEMDAITAVVIGGTSLMGGNANIVGTLFGCIIVGMLNNGLNLMGVNSSWQVIVKGMMCLLALVLDSSSTIFYEKLRNKKAKRE